MCLMTDSSNLALVKNLLNYFRPSFGIISTDAPNSSMNKKPLLPKISGRGSSNRINCFLLELNRDLYAVHDIAGIDSQLITVWIKGIQSAPHIGQPYAS